MIKAVFLAAAVGIAQPQTITVSAAASLSDVLRELAKKFETATGVRVQVNAGSSNSLARQIVEGAPVDLFISADEAQMDVVEKAGRLVAGSRTPLLTNQLVVIVPMGSPHRIGGGRDLSAHVARSTIRRVAMGNPAAVPVGVYARQWLERQAVWRAVINRVVPLPTPGAVLAAVREGRADAGIVYATDARTTSDVTVAYTVPRDEAPAIVYPAAVVSGARQADAARFLAFLQTAEARAIFEAAGFGARSR